jgi:hypothetical protein
VLVNLTVNANLDTLSINNSKLKLQFAKETENVLPAVGAAFTLMNFVWYLLFNIGGIGSSGDEIFVVIVFNLHLDNDKCQNFLIMTT